MDLYRSKLWICTARNCGFVPQLYFVDTGLLCHLLRLESKEELLLILRTFPGLNQNELSCKLQLVFSFTLHLSNVRWKTIWYENPISLNTDEKETCRAFDHLKSGEPYDLTKPTLHVSIMDHTLFPDVPEFYARYALLNIKNGKVYSDKFTLNVLDLTRTDLATEEDRFSGLVQWAKVFQATTWEELLTVSKENPVFTEVIKAMVAVSNDKEKRILIEGRNNYLSTMSTIYSRLNNAETRADNAEARADDLQKKLTAALEELKRYKQ